MNCYLSQNKPNGNLLRHTLFILFWILLLINIQSCGLDVEDPFPPSKPQWVEKSLPQEWPEQGIDAHEDRGIVLEWFSPQNEGIVTYGIFRAIYYDTIDSLTDFIMISNVFNGSTTVIEYIDQNLDYSVRYMYRIQAEDHSGNKSEYSDSVSYKLLRSVLLQTMSPNGSQSDLESNRELRWGISVSFETEKYTITILDSQSNLIARETFNPNQYTGINEVWNIPSSIVLDSAQIYKWRVDISSDYANGRELSGSESNWALFRYNRN